jgi:hypothetical protein
LVPAPDLAAPESAIEDGMYAAIDAISDQDMHPTRDVLPTFVDESPSGQALARRIALTDERRCSLREVAGTRCRPKGRHHPRA